MTSLDAFQRIIAFALTGLAFFHVPVLGLIAWLLSADWLQQALVALALALPPALLLLFGRPLASVALRWR